ncbi:MAG TPA: peptidylprolyl isomerase [Flavobacteriales bacterium]|nr:peptidylprolyl isomerase [Flavobacteriales bacterium]HRQ84906.1 peptidylprolyl isomerase [Flavobacteriales bacterium]
MKITHGTVVSFHYTLTDDSGEVLDSSQGHEAFTYLQGGQMIVPGLEAQMDGKAKGDKFKAVVTPDQGYGEFNKELLQRVPLDRFGGQQVEVGMQFQAGEHGVVTVEEVTGTDVLVNGNHQLAGVTLHFEVEVTEVRQATAEEVSHGHVHGPGGHHH